MKRRSFLKGILAAGVAPYVVTTAGVLMPVKTLWTPSNTIELLNTGEGFVILWGGKSMEAPWLEHAALHRFSTDPGSGGTLVEVLSLKQKGDYARLTMDEDGDRWEYGRAPWL